MTKDDEVLLRELGRLGAAGGSGGRIGARLAARWLPTHAASAEFELAVEPERVLAAARELLGGIDSNVSDLDGVVGSGFLGLNPTVVRVRVSASDRGGTRVIVEAAAKEGLIKQRSAERAVDRLRQQVITLVGPEVI